MEEYPLLKNDFEIKKGYQEMISLKIMLTSATFRRMVLTTPCMLAPALHSLPFMKNKNSWSLSQRPAKT